MDRLEVDKRLQAVSGLARALSSAPNLKDALRQGLAELTILGYPYIVVGKLEGNKIRLLDFTRGRLQNLVQIFLDRFIQASVSLDVEENPHVQAILHNRVVVSTDLEAILKGVSPSLPLFMSKAVWEVGGIKAGVFVPVTYRGKVVGSLSVFITGTEITPEEEALLRTVASQFGLVLGPAMETEQGGGASEQMRFLGILSEQVMNARTEDELLSGVISQLKSACGSDGLGIAVFDKDYNLLKYVGDIPRGIIEKTARWFNSNPALSRAVFETRSLMIYDENSMHLLPEDLQEAVSGYAKTIVQVPVPVNGARSAIIVLAWKEPHKVSDVWQDTFSVVANTVSAGLLRLYQAEGENAKAG